MGFNTNGRNLLLTSIDEIDWLSVHSGIPDDNGSVELTGGSYTREAVAWAAASSGVRASSVEVTHEIPAGATAVAYGYQSASAAGTFYGHALVGASLQGFGAVDADGVTNNTVKSAGHGLANGDRVALYNVHAESLPTGLSEGTLYFVVGVATNTFQVSLTEGGAAVDISAVGELWWQDCVPEAFGSAGQLTADAGDLTVNTNLI